MYLIHCLSFVKSMYNCIIFILYTPNFLLHYSSRHSLVLSYGIVHIIFILCIINLFIRFQVPIPNESGLQSYCRPRFRNRASKQAKKSEHLKISLVLEARPTVWIAMMIQKPLPPYNLSKYSCWLWAHVSYTIIALQGYPTHFIVIFMYMYPPWPTSTMACFRLNESIQSNK